MWITACRFLISRDALDVIHCVLISHFVFLWWHCSGRSLVPGPECCSSTSARHLLVLLLNMGGIREQAYCPSVVWVLVLHCPAGFHCDLVGCVALDGLWILSSDRLRYRSAGSRRLMSLSPVTIRRWVPCYSIFFLYCCTFQFHTQ